eukprot:m51a1_g13759 putative diacylglycerol kinase alpha (619) ;mRNA; f:230664-232927
MAEPSDFELLAQASTHPVVQDSLLFINNGHQFYEKIVGLCTCEFCAQTLIGTSATCQLCHMTCHTRCREKRLPRCVPMVQGPGLSAVAARGEGTVDECAHRFYAHHFKRPTFCNVCREFIFGVGKQGCICEVCRACVHDDCAKTAHDNCRPTSTPGKHETQHAWVEGNVHVVKRYSPESYDAGCVVCGDECGSSSALVDWRCMWCLSVVHSRCLAEVAGKPCRLGPIGPLIAPPHLVGYSSGSTGYALRCEPAEDLPQPWRPLVAFVNRKSGGQQGVTVVSRLRAALNPRQVFDLGEGGPAPGLRFLGACADRARVLVCGGDGTAGWVFEVMRQQGVRVPVAVLPLGTGNDLSRSLGWGPGYEGGSLRTVLRQVDAASVVPLDRWALSVSTGAGPAQHRCSVNNYFSVGLDASIALEFHLRREEDPEAFKSRVGNKLWYVKFSVGELFSRGLPLRRVAALEVDGRELRLADDLLGLVVLNLQSCYAGKDLWGAPSRAEAARGLREASFSDGLVEVVGLRSTVELGQIMAGLTLPEKIAQGREVVIRFAPAEGEASEAAPETADAAPARPETESPGDGRDSGDALPCQVDGEPFLQKGPCVLRLSFLEQALALVPPKRH